MIGSKVRSVSNYLPEFYKCWSEFFNCLTKLFSSAGESFAFWIENATQPGIVHPVLRNMFQNNEKDCDQPEDISKESCDLEDPHGCRLYFKDKGLILLTKF